MVRHIQQEILKDNCTGEAFSKYLTKNLKSKVECENKYDQHQGAEKRSHMFPYQIAREQSHQLRFPLKMRRRAMKRFMKSR